MLIAVDKPHGITSFDVIRKLKHLYPKQKIGHSGTLDPFATGLMLIGVDKDTKRLTELTGLDKSYIATIDFSQDSDTRDLQYRDRIKKYEIINGSLDKGRGSEAGEGFVNVPQEETGGGFIPSPTLPQITKILDTLIPSANLPLTPFSAKKKDGKKLYELARKGEIINESREMKTNAYKIIRYEFPILEVELDVGSGTYIRSIAHRLGQQFGLGGILIGLRRTSIGTFKLADYTMKSIEGTEIKYSEIQ